jgi:hypothetical protein
LWINDPSRVFVARDGWHELTSTILGAAQVQELVDRAKRASLEPEGPDDLSGDRSDPGQLLELGLPAIRPHLRDGGRRTRGLPLRAAGRAGAPVRPGIPARPEQLTQGLEQNSSPVKDGWTRL